MGDRVGRRQLDHPVPALAQHPPLHLIAVLTRGTRVSEDLVAPGVAAVRRHAEHEVGVAALSGGESVADVGMQGQPVDRHVAIVREDVRGPPDTPDGGAVVVIEGLAHLVDRAVHPRADQMLPERQERVATPEVVLLSKRSEVPA